MSCKAFCIDSLCFIIDSFNSASTINHTIAQKERDALIAHSKRQASHWYLCPAVYASRLSVCITINSWYRSPHELTVTNYFVTCYTK